MSGSVFRFRCPACSDVLSASVDMIGANTHCANCGTILEVPRPASLPGKSPTEPPAPSNGTSKPVPKASSEPAFAEEKAVTFGDKRKTEEDELDLTPMVDVTFLLLIFFMVTASFSIQKSLEVPAPKDDSPSAAAQQIEEPEDDPDNIVVRVDPLSTYFVSYAAWDEEREAPSEQEMYKQIRDAKAANPSNPPRTLIVLAHVDAMHGRVVKALDAGSAVGMDAIKLIISEDEDF
ncbi:MAG: biopolymer transporter ExbD [Pirellulaceae bacterium]